MLLQTRIGVRAAGDQGRRKRVRVLLAAALTAFANARPTASLVSLTEELGEEDVVGAQVLSGLLAEAEQRKQVTRFVRDALVRELSGCLPNGWPAVLDDANRFKVAKALGSWFADTPETHREQGLARIKPPKRAASTGETSRRRG